MQSQPPDDPENRRSARSSRRTETFLILRRLSGLGMEILGTILGLGTIGWLIDRWAGTEPWGLIIGVSLGAVGGTYNAVRRTRYYFNAASQGGNDASNDNRHP